MTARANPSLKQSLLAVATMFVLNGLFTGALIGSMPNIADELALGPRLVSWVYVVSGATAIVSIQFAGKWIDRAGARIPTLIGAIIASVAMLLTAFAPNYPSLVACAVVYGLGIGWMDIAMNALGVFLEKSTPRPIMSRLHALFSVGSFIGAGIVVLVAGWLGLPLAAPLIIAGVVGVVVVAISSPITPQSAIHSSQHHEVTPDSGGSTAGASSSSVKASGNPTVVRRLTWLLAGMALCFGLTEGTAVDWASFHVSEVTGLTPALGASGLVVVSAAMVTVRLAGDHLVHRWGRPLVVQVGSVLATGGFTMVATLSSLPLVLLGWLVVGIGVGGIAPQIYALAGHIGGGTALARVTGFGYFAFLAGPAIIGFTAARVGLQHAMFVPTVSAAGLIITASILRRMRLTSTGEQAPTTTKA